MNKKQLEELQMRACFLHVSIPYDEDENELMTFDDGLVTKLELEEYFVPPMLNAEMQRLDFVIDLKSGKMQTWKASDGYVRMWAKVRDSGTYTLLDADKRPFCQIRGYVPFRLIPPFEKGAGDYIELAINADGTINNWPQNLDLSDFVEEGKTPKPIKTNKWHRAEDALRYVKSLKLNEEEQDWLIKELAKNISNRK